jgi:ribulose 1,5-bisphosphate carboxylase large subunit-like protein
VMPGRHTGTQAGGWAVRQAIQAVGGIMVLCQEKRKRIETTPPKSRAAD